MSVDRSLRGKGTLTRHRNVLSRAERVEVLKDKGDWDESQGVLGLPKVAHRKGKAGKKKAAAAGPEKAEEVEEAKEAK